jgi:hypothetical protein
MANQLYEPGLTEYPKGGIILANLFVGSILGMGTVLCWFLSPLLAGLYIGWAVLTVFFVSRRLTCPNCYYHGKWCSVGWGKLSGLLARRGDIDEFGNDVAARLAPVTYSLLILVPLISIIVSMAQEFRISQIVAMVIYLSLFSVLALRKAACSRCKMRLVCRGCAAKIVAPQEADKR